MPSKRKGKIFITDDDQDDREFIISALQASGVGNTFMQFENGQALSSHLQKNAQDRPDIILLDLNMPVKNGFETLHDLKTDSRFRDIPVIVLSASTKKEDETVCFLNGCSHFLTKPLDMDGYREIARFVHNAFFQ